MAMIRTPARRALCASLLFSLAACGPDSEARRASCDTLVTETRATCMDMIRRGLDVSCNTYLGAIDTAMDQASGNLFDVGDANQSAAGSLCSTYIDKLREDRDKNAGSMRPKAEVGPKCAALAGRFETRCMANLGKEPLPGKCKNVARTFLMGASRQIPREKLCLIAGRQLPEG